MIGIEAEKYWGDNWLLIRTWDGIDKPQKSRIFKITEKEIDFEGGRFERMEWTHTDKDSFLQKMIIDYRNHKIEEVINWISENTFGVWNFNISILLDDCFYDGNPHVAVWVFLFKDEEDAMAFKLRWL